MGAEHYVKVVNTVKELAEVLSWYPDWDIALGDTYGHGECPMVEIWANEETHTILFV